VVRVDENRRTWAYPYGEWGPSVQEPQTDVTEMQKKIDELTEELNRIKCVGTELGYNDVLINGRKFRKPDEEECS
jgi:hypothetical protein